MHLESSMFLSSTFFNMVLSFLTQLAMPGEGLRNLLADSEQLRKRAYIYGDYLISSILEGFT